MEVGPPPAAAPSVFGDDTSWFDWLVGSGDNAPPAPPAASTKSDIATLFPTLLIAPVPAVAPAVAPAPTPEPTGCTAQARMRVVCAVGDVFGDGERLSVALGRAQRVLGPAKEERGNEVVVAVLGNVAPTLYAGDALERAVKLHKERANACELVMGRAELAMLRLRDRGAHGELTRASFSKTSPEATAASKLETVAALLQPAPVTGDGLPPLWKRHNEECRQTFGPLEEKGEAVEEDELALALLVKLASMLTRMLHAKPMLGHAVARGGSVTAPLQPYVTQLSEQMSMATSFQRLLALLSDPKAGPPLATAARAVVDDLVSWATDEGGALNEYARAAKLVAFVPAAGENGAAMGDRGFWLLSRGTGLPDGSNIVGRMPYDAKGSKERFEVTWTEPHFEAPAQAREWADALNKQFSDWLSDTNRRDAPAACCATRMTAAFAAMGCTKSDCGPTDAQALEPLAGLGVGAVGMLSASTPPAPFAVARGALRWAGERPVTRALWTVGVADVFAPSMSFALGTFCAGTADTMRVHLALRGRAGGHVVGEECGPKAQVTQALRTLLLAQDALADSVPQMVGVVGPCVVDGDAPGCVLRATWWLAPDAEEGVLMLLPETFLRSCLDEYTRPLERPHGTAALSTEGLLVLPDERRVSAADEGEDPPLVWRLAVDAKGTAPAPGLDTHRGALKNFADAPLVSPALPRRATQQYTSAAVETQRQLHSGTPIEAQLAARLYYVVSDAESALEGLRIRWIDAEAAKGMPLVDVCKTELV